MKEKATLLSFFCEKHGINPALPHLFVEPKIYYRTEFPYAILLRYDLTKLPDNKRKEADKILSAFSKCIIDSFKKTDGVYLSPDGKYYLNYLMEDNLRFYNIIIQMVDEEHDIYIKNIKDVIYKAFLEPECDKSPYYDNVETAIEEAIEEDD